MTDFIDLNLIFDNLVMYFTGSYGMLGLLLSFFLLLIFLGRGLDFRYATIFVIPFLGFTVAIGWFGDVTNSQWIVNLALVVASLFYGVAILKITT